MKQLIIIGGGAAGLAAAIAAARQEPSLNIIILEKLDRIGKKLLATGNGRCNLTNMHASASYYSSKRRDLLKPLLAEMKPEQVLSFFASLGLLCEEEDEGRVYPYCRQASMVVDVLRLALDRLAVSIECGCSVRKITANGGRFSVFAEDGRHWNADAVILCAGGKAASKLGSDGSGFSLAESLGHRCLPLYPGLVALCCDMNRHGGLKGIRAKARLSLYAGTHLLGEETGELQFTEQGLSGIPAMQLSGKLAILRKGEICTAEVDLFPGWTEQTLYELLQKRKTAFAGETIEQLLLGTIHKRLAYAVMKTAGLQPLSREIDTLKSGELRRLAETAKHWQFRVIQTTGWETAQVTGGGIPLSEINPENMGSVCCDGLYLAGEVLDVMGACGGFNLHWAWCSGIRAGQSAAREVMK